MDNFSLGAAANMAPTGIASFAKCSICTDIRKTNADVAIIGAPFDIGIQGRTGARLGPRGIRTASTRFSYKPGGSYDYERHTAYMDANLWSVEDCGDVDYVPGDLRESFSNLTEAVRILTERGALPVILGGDHSITYPILKGFKDAGTFHIIHFDAHLDWTKSVSGQKYSNGSPMRNAATLPYVDHMIHIGLRGLGSSTPTDFADSLANGDSIFSVKEARNLGVDALFSSIPIGEKVYVSFDIDAMEATLAPATGSPMFGGFWYNEIVDMLEALAARFKVIGMDMVEVAPQYDGPGGNTCYLAARLISDLLGFVLKQREIG